jgi:AAA+ ATPase superfamily predicted ATPase
VFVNRQPELTFLNSVLEQRRPTVAQFILLYGRRRVGKTVLLRHWAEHVDRRAHLSAVR